MTSSNKQALIILGAVAAVGLVVCCGGGLALMNFGFGELAKEIEYQVQAHPTVQQHIGEVETFEMEMGESFGRDDEDEFVYSIKGSKGSGKITVLSITDENLEEVIESATLEMDDGTVHELDASLFGPPLPME